jgi:hypothetical protein
MIFSKLTDLKAVIVVPAVLALAACSMEGWKPRGGETEAGSSEHLLEAEGSWAMVEEHPGSDPAALHSQAKTEVNPADLKHKQFLPDQDLKMAMNDKAAHGGEDVNYRLIRVERDVQSLREDFRKLLPPLSNLIVADKNLDKTIDDIAAKNAIEPASGMAPQAAAPAERATGAPVRMAAAAAPVPRSGSPTLAAKMQPVMPVSASSGSGTAVSNLRLGEYPAKTRLVLDLSGPSPYSTELDNGEKLLVVQIPKAGWTAEQRKSLGNHPLVAGYTAQPGPDGGTTLAIELKKPVKIAASSALPPNATYKSHRIFIDLAAI